MAYIGNGPGVASQRITTTLTATASQTTFTPTSGYTVGYIDVYLNGVRLVNGTDYTASNGTTVVLASGAAENDVMEIVAYLPRGLSDGYTKAEADNRYMSASATTLPSQTDNSGKFLTTDGTDASWATINVSPTPANVSDQANASTGYFDLPAGTTAQRPGSPGSGMVRFNTDDGNPEWYDTLSGSWRGFNQGRNYVATVLVAAGGGGGGCEDVGGGGGAGGLVITTSTLIPQTTYSVVVGFAGSGGVANALNGRGGNGGDSTFNGITAVGGGGGGAGNTGTAYVPSSGGSGGGGSWGQQGGDGTIGQGNAGGAESYAGVGAGGGGGSGAVGGNGSGNNGGNGGAGTASDIVVAGINVFYAAGGGGGADATGGTGGSGIGGNGGGLNTGGTPAGANTASGGGGTGGYSSPAAGSNGGSGVVILRIPTTYYTGQTTGSPTVSSDGANIVLIFTSSGSYTA